MRNALHIALLALAPLGARADLASAHAPEFLVTGVVVHQDGRPFVGATVEAYRAGVSSAVPGAFWHVEGLRRRQSHGIGSATTDGEGRFVLKSAHIPPALLRAVGGPGLHAFVELPGDDAREEPGEHRIELPAEAFVCGRVLAPPGADPSLFVVRAGPTNAVGGVDPYAWMEEFDAFSEARLDRDGAFRLGPFGTGKLRLGIVPADSVGRGTTLPFPAMLEDRELDLAPGEQQIDVDLTATWPGEVELSFRAGDVPLTGAQVVLLGPGERAPWVASDRVDADGVVRFDPLPGEYRLHVLGPGHLWEFDPPERVVVDSQRFGKLHVQVPAVHGSLTVISHFTGEPAAGEPVMIARPDGPGLRSWVAAADELGRVSLALTEGPVWVARVADASAAGRKNLDGMTRVEWTASGPEPARVVLTR